MADSTPSKVDIALDAIQTLEDIRGFVATMTGVRDQFVEAGWMQHTAELMTYQILAGAAKGASST